MSHRAYIYLQPPGIKIAIDLGEQELEMRPTRHGRARFEHEGIPQAGHIEQVDPPDWEARRAIPKVLVVQRQ
jgi:hypothetical protein